MGSLPQPGFEDKLSAILAICRKMTFERELGPLLDVIASEAAKLLACERVSIFLVDGRRNSEATRFRISMGTAGWAAMKGESPPAEDGTRNVLAVAMHNQAGEIVGVLEALNKRSAPFPPRAEEWLRVLASHAAGAIRTAELVRDLRHSHDELARENAHLWREVEQRHNSHGIVGAGPKIQEILRLIERIRDSVVNVLITGESGTGKELIAKAVHFSSPRARQPFVVLNCAALPDAPLKSSQQANGGTLFLDKIGNLNPAGQAKILRILQEQVVGRVGDAPIVAADARLLAATNKD